MTTAEITVKMIGISGGNLHDISHFLKVYAVAKTIGECEHLPPQEQLSLEVAALLHDIACPRCREKYGSTIGKYQEAEGMPLARRFLADCALSPEVTERVVYLVGHHHTTAEVIGADYQILLEADALVNAEESSWSRETLLSLRENLFKTKTGLDLLQSIHNIG